MQSTLNQKLRVRKLDPNSRPLQATEVDMTVRELISSPNGVHVDDILNAVRIVVAKIAEQYPDTEQKESTSG